MARHLGIDIGSSSIKIIESNDSGSIDSQLIFANPVGRPLVSMTNSEKIALVDLIKKNLADNGISNKKAVVSIPESQVYSKVMRFPRMSTPELATAIRWELDQNVPFPPNEIEMSWALMDGLKRLNAPDELISYVVAVPTKVSEAYVQFFEAMEFEIERLENENVAVQRSLVSFVPQGGVCLSVDFGYSGTNIVLLKEDAIISSYFFSVGGLSITKLISDTFSLTMEQAENYKRTYGILADQLDGKMVTVLKPVIDSLALEIKKMLVAYKTDYGDFGSLRVVVSGGGSFLAGMTSFLSTTLDGVEVLTGNVFEGTNLGPEVVPLGPIFVVARGLSITL